MSILSGQEFGDYVVEEQIVFRGAIGLYLARNRVQNSPVLLEIVEPTLEQDPDLADRFQQRIDRIARLQHPSVATITHTGVTASDQCYATMEHFPGVSLTEKLSAMAANGERMPAVAALTLVKTLAEALAVIHRAGLVHQDLGPDSILIDTHNVPVLYNLGLPDSIASIPTEDGDSFSYALDYSSPEQNQGQPVTPRSNIYSLGILLYELLAGHRPEVPSSSWDIFGQRRESPRAIPLQDVRAGLAPETYQLVKNCLWREEWNRYENVHDMLEALELAISAERELAIKTALAPRRRRWLVAGVSALLFLVLLGPGLLRTREPASDQSVSASQPVAATPRATAPLALALVVEPSATPTRRTAGNGDITPTVRLFIPVELIGPAPESEFVSGERISFQWSWPFPLESDQQFAVYLLSGTERTLMGTVAGPLDSDEYRLQANSESSSMVGSFLWQVILEAKASGEVLSGSDQQPIVLTPPDTPTATATATPTATPTEAPPTATATSTPTPTPDCVRTQPPGWVRYIIRPGDVLFTLAVRTGTTINRIREVNCLPNNVLAVGQPLWLPAPPVTDTPVPPPPPPSGGPGPPPGPQPPPSRPTPTPPPAP